MFDTWLSRVAPIAAALLVAGCTTPGHVTSIPTVQTSSPSLPAVGSVSGVDEVCAGPPSVRPRRATVRLIENNVVVATSSVIAGDPVRDHYRLAVAPGRYVVRASNWPRSDRAVKVEGGENDRVNFPNICD